MLAQMVHPAFNQESLEDASLLCGIFEHAPGIGTVPTPLVLEARQRFEERFAIGGGDAGLGGGQHGAPSMFAPRRGHRPRPTQRCAVSGDGQCIDGERSRATPVCSFQRQVSAIAATAPAAARKCALATPTRTATWPHAALPIVRQPKKTVV